MKRISPTTVIACLALFFSLTGAGLAASHYLITSVNQIKPSVRHALQGRQGPQGLPGSVGPQGATGTQGALSASVDFSQIHTVVSAPVNLTTANSSGGTYVACPSGYDVLNGGYQGAGEIVTYSFAKAPNEWAVWAVLGPGSSSGYVRAFAECVPA